MDQNPYYDYIILGAGLSGLTLCLSLLEDSFFDDKTILLLDRQEKKENDRTWCYWHKGDDPFESIVSRRWKKIAFKSASFKQHISLGDYTYKKIESEDFYEYCFKKLAENDRVDFKVEQYQSQEEDKEGIKLVTDKGIYLTKKVFSSILPTALLQDQKKHQVLHQHFVGWQIKTDTAAFDPEVATFMDFSIPQRFNTRFMYVLPNTPNEALLEYTLFSEDLLPQKTYERGIKSYLKKLGISDYDIINKEKGIIPMTVYPFEKHNSRHLVHIGTAGGWTRASTGYTFTYTQKRTGQLIAFLKKKDDFRKFKIRDRYRWYDRLLLDVLYRKNKLGSTLFEAMFKRNKIDRIFRFLDGNSSFRDDLKLIWSLPKKEFIVALFRRNRPL